MISPSLFGFLFFCVLLVRVVLSAFFSLLLLCRVLFLLVVSAFLSHLKVTRLSSKLRLRLGDYETAAS